MFHKNFVFKGLHFFFKSFKKDTGTSQGDVGRLLLAIFIDGIMVGMILTHIPLMLKYNGETSRVIGWVLGVTSLTSLIASPLVGRVAAKFGMARAIMVAGLLNACLALLMGLSQDPLYWGIIRFFAGFCVAVRWLGMEAWVNNLAESTNRGRIMTLYTTCFTTAVAIGGGLIGHIFLDGLLPYGVMAGLLLLSSLPILKMKHQTIKLDATSKNSSQINFLQILKNNPVVLIVAIASGVMFGASGMITVQTINHGFTPQDASFVVFLYFIGPIILFPIVSHVVNNFSAKKLIPCAGMLAAICAWPAFYTQHLTTIQIFIMIYGAMELIIYSSLLSFIGQHYRGLHMIALNSLVVMVYNATSMVTAPVAGEMMTRFGLLGLPLLMMTVGLLALSIWFYPQTKAGTKVRLS